MNFSFFQSCGFLFFFFFLTRLNFHNVAQKLLLLLLLWGGGLFVCLFVLFVCLFCLYSISGYPVGAINFVFTTVILKYNSCRILLIYLLTFVFLMQKAPQLDWRVQCKVTNGPPPPPPKKKSNAQPYFMDRSILQWLHTPSTLSIPSFPFPCVNHVIIIIINNSVHKCFPCIRFSITHGVHIYASTCKVQFTKNTYTFPH